LRCDAIGIEHWFSSELLFSLHLHICRFIAARRNVTKVYATHRVAKFFRFLADVTNFSFQSDGISLLHRSRVVSGTGAKECVEASDMGSCEATVL
jgi:hypothetical protein